MPPDRSPVRLFTTDLPGADAGPIRLGGIVTASAVSGANLLRDMREAITNTIGGPMTRYERLLDDTIARAFETLSARAAAAGYDGVVAIRISHPAITDGAIEVVVCGTGYHNLVA